MNIKELREQLYDYCQDAGSVRAWADRHKLSFSYVAAVIRGDSNPGSKVLKAMGLKKSFNLKKKPMVMKFEDI